MEKLDILLADKADKIISTQNSDHQDIFLAGPYTYYTRQAIEKHLPLFNSKLNPHMLDVLSLRRAHEHVLYPFSTTENTGEEFIGRPLENIRSAVKELTKPESE